MSKEKYQRAESFLPWNLQKITFNSAIFPYWTHEALYYFQESREGKTLIRVDFKNVNKKEILDFDELINKLSIEIKTEVDIEKLPLNKFSIQENPMRLSFTYQSNNWCYNAEKQTCFKEAEIVTKDLKSPDDNWLLSVKEHNLVLENTILKEKFNLTNDGEKYYDYASSPETNTYTITQKIAGIVPSPVASWSPDSKKIVTHKLDQRRVDELFILQNAPKDSLRPVVHNYRMSFSGDTYLPLAELLIIDVQSKKIIPIKAQASLSPYLTPLEFNWVWWSADSQKVYFIQETRASKELMLCMADTNSGLTEILIHEAAENTYIEPSTLAPWPHQIIIIEKQGKIIWLSERSGYPHLYLYDMKNKSQSVITKGEWYLREVHFYDDELDWLYFTACGYDKKIDPYYKQLFRCRLNGEELECLTGENAYHSISISPQKNCFIDTFSTIDTAPITLLKKMNGGIICHLETANIKALDDLNWVPPKRICLKARDGVTNIYGNLYFPSNFDPNRKYPIIDHIYPGPQFYRTSPHFTLYGAIFRSAWLGQALAELGFIVLHIDGLGTPGRSKEFHDATYGNIGDCGIPDHVAAIKQLAKENSYIDIEKVGITGYSGGGYATARAMLMYPDFFKVGVAAGGNHDLRCYPASYGEKYNTLDATTYSYQSNAAHAEKLQGKLLLVHGEMDDNVHPCATMQLVDALIKQNKDFDMLIMPNQNHASTFDHPYYIRRCWDYFVRNLLEENPTDSYLIKPMPTEFPQIRDW